ncbi:MAG: SHOCT domain-containing protein [Anaerolineales bacterium]|nr:SHOCT domain-containing protein [Anaerolineales bacterium]
MMGWFSGCCGFGGLGGFGSFGWIGLIINLVIIVGVILLIVWIVRRITAGGASFTSNQSSEGAHSSPREILDIRYARGEIDRELYQQMLSDLN